MLRVLEHAPRAVTVSTLAFHPSDMIMASGDCGMSGGNSAGIVQFWDLERFEAMPGARVDCAPLPVDHVAFCNRSGDGGDADHLLLVAGGDTIRAVESNAHRTRIVEQRQGVRWDRVADWHVDPVTGNVLYGEIVDGVVTIGRISLQKLDSVRRDGSTEDGTTFVDAPQEVSPFRVRRDVVTASQVLNTRVQEESPRLPRKTSLPAATSMQATSVREPSLDTAFQQLNLRQDPSGRDPSGGRNYGEHMHQQTSSQQHHADPYERTQAALNDLDIIVDLEARHFSM